VVPGVTAALAAGAMLGLPLTDRKSASKLIFCTGHHAADKADWTPIWSGPLPEDATLVVYMPGRDLGRIAQELMTAGVRADMPCCAVSHVATERQSGEKRLYVLDESSLASTRQMHEFIEHLHRNDRVLLVGDSRQHEAVEAGRPFAQLQEAGMRTATLNDIVRRRDPELKQVVEQLARGQVGAAVESLDQQGRVHEVRGISQLLNTINSATRCSVMLPPGAMECCH
jgi:AAA domain/Tetrapyrrole (Corrin/Porphyrin) Methylases